MSSGSATVAAHPLSRRWSASRRAVTSAVSCSGICGDRACSAARLSAAENVSPIQVSRSRTPVSDVVSRLVTRMASARRP
jgi:hypothetical protein